MKLLRSAALLACMAALVGSAHGTKRDLALRRAYIKEHPCPFTKEQGCILDHKVALCLGGADARENMQWITKADAKQKDRDDKRACAAKRRQPR